MQRIRAGLISIQQGKRRRKKESNWGLRWKLRFAPSRSGNSSSLVFKQPKILTEQRRLHIKRISGFLDSKCLNRNNRNHGSISGEGYISSSISGPPLSLAISCSLLLYLCDKQFGSLWTRSELIHFSHLQLKNQSILLWAEAHIALLILLWSIMN